MKKHEFTNSMLDMGCDNFREKPRKKSLKIRFKKLSPDAVIPRRGTSGSAGFDLTAIDYQSDEIAPRIWTFYTGIAMEIPAGYVGLVFPRSSVYKTGALLSNSVGVIDSDYRGEITLKFSSEARPYNIGDRIGQLVVVQIPTLEFVQSDELSTTERGAGGYGSTGK